MLVYPAVDIAKGRCVRLLQGKPDREKVYYKNPAEAALHWQGLGAQTLHVVDLDGALAGDSPWEPLRRQTSADNVEVIREILRRTGIPVQVAGGLRSAEAVREALAAGAARAVVGTRAVKEPEWAVALCRELAGRIVIALDALEGQVAVEGWQHTVEKRPTELARRLAAGGPAAFLYTDVSRDGTLTRPNVEAVKELLDAVEVPIIASGGVATLDDIRLLGECGADGVIVGKALYEGRLALPEAVEAAAEFPSRLSAAPAV
jgi:phosphoribosylformimino-5-aminoimidazole carboxamide ribotide isomerase